MKIPHGFLLILDKISKQQEMEAQTDFSCSVLVTLKLRGLCASGVRSEVEGIPNPEGFVYFLG